MAEDWHQAAGGGRGDVTVVASSSSTRGNMPEGPLLCTGQTIKFVHIASNYTLPPTFLIGSAPSKAPGLEVEEKPPLDLTFQQVHPPAEAVPEAQRRYLRALPGGVADWSGASDESEYDRRATHFAPLYHSPHINIRGERVGEVGLPPHEQPVVSLRGRLLADEDYVSDKSAYHRAGGAPTHVGTPDLGCYLGVKGSAHTLVSNAGLGPDSRFRVVFVDPIGGGLKEPQVGGRLRHEAEQKSSRSS